MARDTGWHRAPVIYEIYPRSFLDSTGSGVGDLQGIVSRLDHVASLGVDAIWLCPFFVSPLHDGGYDVADHRAIDPRMGTDGDFDQLVARAHDLGLRVIVDQVFNHTSTHHDWFRRAVDGDEEMAARYVWRNPKPDGTPPNNWLSQFGPPAWTWNHRRRQYFFHQFLACQPNLDLRNEQVIAMHCETMNHWLARGVDGFRLDAVTSYLFDESLADNPPARPVVQDRVTGPNYNPYTYQDHVNDMLPGDGAAYAARIREWVGDDVFLMGESTSGNNSVTLGLGFTEPGRLNHCYTTDPPAAAASAGGLAGLLDRLGGQWRAPFWFSCHDHPRHNTALGDGTAQSAKFHALLLATLPGATLLYQGEELGLPQPQLTGEETTDPFDLLYWPDPPGREGPRVPMPWTEQGAHCGFTTGTPWLPMRWGPGLSVGAQQDDPDSVLNFYRRAFAWRRETGALETVRHEASEHVLSMHVVTAKGRWHAVFNFSRDTALPVPTRQGDEPALATGWSGRDLCPLGGAVWAEEGQGDAS